ncbi:oligosaccharide flippase family protein [Aestuariibacter sp. AA17]|uniref:Oligosaccharide flippase family protein n=1 Tax=Fluctibacter corallii TaxID=2984329 RepID=A0ABT3A3M6_9ALTE|nr:oligosaccharide flippase family protein [Aestuariibacter sp. AA17]MCV2883285.1 oligosaccharide flippase family protein [Aestuariibacter sp. AA17]
MRAGLTRGISWTASVSIIRAIIQLIQLMLLTQLLDNTIFAAFVVLQSFFIIASVPTEFGLGTLIVVRQRRSATLLRNIVALQLIVATLIGLLLLLVGQSVFGYFSAQLSGVHFVLSVILLLLMTLAHVPFSQLQRDLKWKDIAVSELLWSSITFSAIGVALAYSPSLTGVLIGMAVGHTARLWVLYRYVYHYHGAILFPSWHITPRTIKYLAYFGAFRTGAMFVNQLASHLDVFIIGRFLGAEALALYGAAKALMMRVSVFVSGLTSRICLPLLSKQKQREPLQRLYIIMLCSVAALVLPLFAVIGSNAELVCVLLFGESYRSASMLLQILCGVFALRMLVNVGGQVIMSRAAVKASFWWNLTLLPISAIVYIVAAQHTLVELVYSMFALQGTILFAHTWLMLGGIAKLNPFRVVFIQFALLVVFAGLCASIYTGVALLALPPEQQLVAHIAIWGLVFGAVALYVKRHFNRVRRSHA